MSKTAIAGKHNSTVQYIQMVKIQSDATDQDEDDNVDYTPDNISKMYEFIREESRRYINKI